MKKVGLILSGLIFAFGLMAQNKKIESVTVDTVKGNETVTFDFSSSGINTTDGVLAFQALFTQIGGTSDGSAYLEFSVDGTSWVRYADAQYNEWISLFAADTSKLANNGNEFTISDGGVFGGALLYMPWEYMRISAAGTANDTTSVTVKYQFVKRK